VAELEAAASAAYGDDWESRGLTGLATAAVGLAAVFPLAALLAPGSAAPAIGKAAASGAGRMGRGLLAKLGTGKAALTIAAGTLAVGTAAVVVTTTLLERHGPRPTPRRTQLAVALASEQKYYTDGVVAVNAKVAQVTGIADATLRTRINAALRAPVDRWFKEYLNYSSTDIPAICQRTPGSTNVTTTLRTDRLLGVAYDLAPPCTGGNHPPYRSGVGVTVDLRTGRVLSPHVVFRPDSMAALSRTVLPSAAKLIREHSLISPEEYKLTWANIDSSGPFDSNATQVAWYPDHLAFVLNMPLLGTVYAESPRTVRVSYPRLRGLMKPDVASLLPG
jgi:serine/threonine-protein kinase